MTAPVRLSVLFEDNHCLAVNKPPRLLTVGDITGEPTLFDAAKAYIKQKYNKPGDVFLGVVHRLDRPVSGVVLFARTSKGAARLSAQFRDRDLQKTYIALVEGRPPQREETIVHWLRKNHDTNVVSVVPPNSPDAQRAELSYRVIANRGDQTLVEVFPKTGRSHQIRVQLAAIGTPIVGDGKYGSTTKREGTICLHAAALEFEHPTTKETIVVEAALPDWAR